MNIATASVVDSNGVMTLMRSFSKLMQFVFVNRCVYGLLFVFQWVESLDECAMIVWRFDQRFRWVLCIHESTTQLIRVWSNQFFFAEKHILHDVSDSLNADARFPIETVVAVVNVCEYQIFRFVLRLLDTVFRFELLLHLLIPFDIATENDWLEKIELNTNFASHESFGWWFSIFHLLIRSRTIALKKKFADFVSTSPLRLTFWVRVWMYRRNVLPDRLTSDNTDSSEDERYLWVRWISGIHSTWTECHCLTPMSSVFRVLRRFRWEFS